MKTLYINLNNEDIQSNENLIVLPHRLDIDILFYIGEKIAGRCRVNDETSLITDFNKAGNEYEYMYLTEQIDELKSMLFGLYSRCSFEFKLPAKYIDWLKYHPVWNNVHSKNFLTGKPSVKIDLEELYEVSVKNLMNKILRTLERDDLYKEIDEIVFNDDTVTRKSPIVDIIKEKYDGIGFKSYKKWLQDNDEKPLTTPQVCEKCKKNPCECNTDEQFCYAVEISTDPSWLNKSKYKFFDHKGQPLDDNEYYIVAQGRDDNYGIHYKTNLLVIKTENDPTLYFISADGTFHKIGEYYYKHSSYSGIKEKQCHKYDGWIIQNNFILYRNNRDFKLFEIKSNNTITENASFSSKEIIYPERVIKNYLACGEFTIDYHTGENVKINGSKRGNLIGFYNVELYYLVAENWDEEETLINCSIVDSKGKVIKRKFGYDSFEYLSDNLLIVELYIDDYYERRYGIANIIGDTLLPCIYRKMTKVTDDIYKLETEDFDEFYYIVSKNKIVNGYNDDYYVKVTESGLNKIYRFDTDEFINQIMISDDEIGILGNSTDKNFISNLYGTEGNGNGELRLILDNSTIYEFSFRNEEFVGVSKSVFVVKGDSYIEVYDLKGNMIRCIDIDSDYMSNFVLHHNGYISFWNSKKKTTGWFDNDYVIHYASDYVKSDTYLDVEKITPNNTIILRSRHETFVVCNGDCVYRGYKLDKIDDNNFYGADYNFEDNENNWCIVNIEKGTIPVHGKCGEVYLIK